MEIGTLALAIVVVGVLAGTGLWVLFPRDRAARPGTGDIEKHLLDGRPAEGHASVAAAHRASRWDLWVGLFGAIGGNVLLFLLLRGGWLSPLVGLQAFNGEALAAALINIGGLIVCRASRRRMAVGMLIGDGITLLLGLAVAVSIIASGLAGLGAPP